MNIRALFLLIATATSAFAQQKTHTLHGTVTDPRGAVIGGVRLMFKSGDKIVWAASDVNGDFQASLAPGNYEATADSPDLYKFTAFINIGSEGLNPDRVNFSIDPSSICCRSKSGVPFPKALSLPKPPYPPAARAVRASGEVVISVKIDGAGFVTSSSALNGHPLLRQAAQAAARGARFETSESTPERDANLTYVFLTDTAEKPGVHRFDTPFRIKVYSDVSVVVQTLADKS